MAASPNFEFLKIHDPQLVRLGSLAERYFTNDPNTCLIKLRQFGEMLAQLTAANVGMYTDAEETQVSLLRRLRDRGILKGSLHKSLTKFAEYLRGAGIIGEDFAN